MSVPDAGFDDDDPALPQNYDEIIAFLAIWDAASDDTLIGEIKARWDAKREEMRADG